MVLIIERMIQETNRPFKDRTNIIYVNGRITDETELGKLMSDFQCTDYEEMHYDVRKERVKYFKNDVEGIITMKEIVEDWEIEIAEKSKKAGIQEGIYARNKSLVLNLKGKNYSEEQISELLDLSIDQVRKFLTT